ncbi:unnamed protein product [Prunus armeniaca]
MGIPAGSKGDSPPSSLHANIPGHLDVFCLKLIPSHVLEPPSSFAYMDLQAPFVAFVLHPSAWAFAASYSDCMGFLRQQVNSSNKWANLIKCWAILVKLMGYFG